MFSLDHVLLSLFPQRHGAASGCRVGRTRRLEVDQEARVVEACSLRCEEMLPYVRRVVQNMMQVCSFLEEGLARSQHLQLLVDTLLL